MLRNFNTHIHKRGSDASNLLTSTKNEDSYIKAGTRDRKVTLTLAVDALGQKRWYEENNSGTELSKAILSFKTITYRLSGEWLPRAVPYPIQQLTVKGDDEPWKLYSLQTHLKEPNNKNRANVRYWNAVSFDTEGGTKREKR